jgi:hypothetical protein
MAGVMPSRGHLPVAPDERRFARHNIFTYPAVQACLQRKTLVLAARLVYETRIHMDGRQRLPVGDRLTVGPQTLTLVV